MGSAKNLELTGAQALVKVLEEKGVTHIFGYPGGANLPIFDALRQSRQIQFVLARHEQGAAHMAEGFARIKNRPGVVLATSGPGATNLVTGLADALLDSIPLVALTGQIPREFIGTDAFQEVDCLNITMPVTKHNELVHEEAQLVPALEAAFYIADTGRKGPVLVDIPKDVLTNSYPHQFGLPLVLPGYNPTVIGNVGQVKKALKALNKAARPVVLVGGGVVSAGAVPELLEFVRKLKLPVVRTLMGTGVIPVEDPLYIGLVGTHGNQAANRLVQKDADVIFAIGTKLGNRATMRTQLFSRNATLIHLDIDPAEISKVIPAQIPIVGSIKETLRDMLRRIQEKPIRQNQIPWIIGKKSSHLLATQDQAEVLELVIKALSAIDRPLHVSTDVGRHQMWANHYCTNPKHLPLLTSGGLGTMGFGLPAAIGAWFAQPDRSAVNLTGDGSFMMNMQEFAVAVEYQIPLVVCVFNDGRLSMIRELQNAQYGKRHIAHDLGPRIDYMGFAKAMGGTGYRVLHEDNIGPMLLKALNGGRPCIIDFDLEKIAHSGHLHAVANQ